MPQASPRGTYLLIADALRNEIMALGSGAALPSEASLMERHQVSRNTVRRALKALEADHLIVSKPGTGWRVSGQPTLPLVDKLINLIAEDGLGVGDSFPSESRLCDRFEASRNAVRRALAQMEGRGLLATAHGKGRTVCALPAAADRP